MISIELNLPMMIGYAATIIGIIALTITNKRILMVGTITNITLSSIHYFMLGNITMSAVQGLGGIRIFCARKWEGNKSLYWFFMISGLLVLFLTYKEWHNVISYLGYASGTTAYFFHDKIKMRVMFFIGGLSMFISATMSGSVPFMITEGIGMTINLLAIRHHKIKDSMTIASELSNLIRNPLAYSKIEGYR